ncbi:MAG: oligosaccharide repeat unit polymerase [Planctomycetaceae bacterium]|nr:oligosaccharide repeat unit polymerase [Planctomycetaceae bacterium]
METLQSEISNGFSYVILIIVFGLIGLDCSKDLRRLVSARNVFLITIAAWYLLEACLAPEKLRVFTQTTYHHGLFCVLLCVMSFLAVYHNSQGGIFDTVFRRLGGIDSPRLLWNVFIAACLIGFLPLFYVTEGNPIPILEDAFLPKARWSSIFRRGRYGGVRDAFLELQMFLRAAVPLAAAILVTKRQSQARRLVVTAFLAYSFARALNSGTRSKVAEVFLPMAAAIYWRLSPSWKRRALLVGLPSLLILGLAWSAASVVTRNSGKFDWSAALDADYVGFEMFRELLFITNAVPEKADFKYGHTYYVQAVNPIPRAIWPGKPDNDAGLELARFKGMTSNGQAFLTVSPGLIGEMYWNGGISGILLISAFLGYIAKSWDRVRAMAGQSVLAFTVFAAGLAIIFLSGRSFNMSTLYGLIALGALLILFSRRQKRRRGNHQVWRELKSTRSEL